MTTLDFSLYGTPEGNKELAAQLIKAVREDGFFYVKNFNISQERVNRQFSIGKQFYDLPLEEKLRYVPEGLGKQPVSCAFYLPILMKFIDNGQFNGYVPAGRRV